MAQAHRLAGSIFPDDQVVKLPDQEIPNDASRMSLNVSPLETQYSSITNTIWWRTPFIFSNTWSAGIFWDNKAV
jgi:hypothetical protein